MLPQNLQKKIRHRKKQNTLRALTVFYDKPYEDFASNDYLGLARESSIAHEAQKILNTYAHKNGSTASRLLCGTHRIHLDFEKYLSNFYQTPAVLLFNSGYDANIGFFSAILDRESIIFYDAYIHASIRDGISLSRAKAYKFPHNDLEDLKRRFKKLARPEKVTYIVVEALYSMDGDTAPLREIAAFAHKNRAYLIVDEAHSNGVFGKGLVAHWRIVDKVFARICTFGKAFGTHGAAVLCQRDLRAYLINFARSFIYTTALSPHSVAIIWASYRYWETHPQNAAKLHQNIQLFKKHIRSNGLEKYFIESHSPIQSFLIGDATKAKNLADKLQKDGFGVYAIISPTVPKTKERIRICLHSYNDPECYDDFFKRLNANL